MAAVRPLCLAATTSQRRARQAQVCVWVYFGNAWWSVQLDLGNGGVLACTALVQALST